MKLKRLMAALALAAVLLSLTVPAWAASSFRDMEDSSVAVDAEVLRLMGVVNGVGGNYFNPGANLTRAEFCTMVIRLMGREDEVVNYNNRTIFSDVTARHWGRGYINLAASTTVGGGSTRLIAGVGDGRFLPDDDITYAQAVTILMRILGYDDADAGAIWPDGYLKLAASVKLTGGLGLGAGDLLPRAQAAELFANLLTTPTAEGGLYYTTLGAAVENVLILDVDAAEETGAIRTSQGLYYLASDSPAPLALQGYRGTLVLNEKKEVVTFIPDGSLALSITLGSDAQASVLKDTAGKRYTIPAQTPVYTQEGETTFNKVWADLRSGAQVTLYQEEGKVIGLYYTPGAGAATEAYVVTAPLSSAALHYLTGGAGGYTIRKANETIGQDDIQMYDVLTYDGASNTIWVSDLRLSFVYEQAFPNPETPETITVLGHEFPVLESALESISRFKVGDSAILLLTADGSVAGLLEPSHGARGTMIGLAEGGGVRVALPNGAEVKLSGSVDEARQGRLVSVYGEKSQTLGISSLPVLRIPGDLDLDAMTLGDYRVAAGAQVYEQVANGTLIPTRLDRLEMGTISKEDIVNYHLNTSGMVDLLVLGNLTGDIYTYGILVEGTHTHSLGSMSATNTTVSVTNGSGGQEPVITGRSFEAGAFAGVAVSGKSIGGLPVAADIVELSEISGVKRADFFQMDGAWYVKAKGTVYRVADRVEGYIAATKSWFTQEADRLETIRNYSNDMTLYVDPIGYQVRIIVAN